MTEPLLSVKKLGKSYDWGRHWALRDCSFSLQAGQIYAIVGESGSGKSTLARLIAGLEQVDEGQIFLRGREVASERKALPPEKRGVGMVFQDYALFPHLTVAQNVAYGLAKGAAARKRSADLLDLVGLASMGDRYPQELSGGQQQRVALARALAPEPSLLILDEPFSNLDVMLRHQLRNELFNILKKTGVTALFVTHDTQDALSVADEILILRAGRLVQKDQARKLYQQPESIYVASLFGDTLSLDRRLREAFQCPFQRGCSHAIRSEHLAINRDCDYVSRAKVLERQFLGTHSRLVLALDNGEQLTVTTREAQLEDYIQVGFNARDLLAFREEGTED